MCKVDKYINHCQYCIAEPKSLTPTTSLVLVCARTHATPYKLNDQLSGRNFPALQILKSTMIHTHDIYDQRHRI